jgi:hypothetical protein
MYRYPNTVSSYNNSQNLSLYPVGNLDIETINFVNRVLNLGGNVLTDQELSAINYWIKAYKYYNLWDRIVAHYPYVGGNGISGSVNSFRANIKSDLYNLTNVGGVAESHCTSTGWQNLGSVANASTAVWNTNILDLNLNMKNKSMAAYIRSNQTKVGPSTGITDMGAILANYTNMHILTILFATNPSPNVAQYICGNPIDVEYPNYRINSGILGIQGWWCGTTYFNTATLAKNGIVVKEGRPTFPETGINANIHLGCALRSDPVRIDVSNRSYGSFSITEAYSASENIIRATIEQNFQSMLNRQVNIIN